MQKYIYVACSECGAERWVQMSIGKPVHRRCYMCGKKAAGLKNRGLNSSNWKGGRFRNRDGYILVKLQPDDSFYPLANSAGYVMEHRLIMAQKIGRLLLKSEDVHHIDGIKDHNDDNNLLLVSRLNHNVYTIICKDCLLRKEIRLVQLQNKLLLEQIRELNLKLMEGSYNGIVF